MVKQNCNDKPFKFVGYILISKYMMRKYGFDEALRRTLVRAKRAKIKKRDWSFKND